MKITDTIERNHFTNDPAELDNFISELLLERFDGEISDNGEESDSD